MTTEAGGTATFTVVLNAAADRDVTIALTSSDPTEGTVVPAEPDLHDRQLERRRRRSPSRASTTRSTTATSPTRSSPRRRPAPTRTTADSTPPTSRVTNTDNDSAGITVTPTVGLTTTEAGGDGDLHGRAELAADGRRDDRPDSERHDRGHGPGERLPSRRRTGTSRRRSRSPASTTSLVDGDVALHDRHRAPPAATRTYHGDQPRRRRRHQHRQRHRRHHRDADVWPDDDRGGRDGDLHGGADDRSRRRRDDRPDLERHDRGHGRRRA